MTTRQQGTGARSQGVLFGMDYRETRERRSGRVILLNEDGSVLLMHGFDPGAPDQPWWFTPGGGLEPGETTRQAAARELHEETGLVVEPEQLGEVVFANDVEFVFDGRLIRQHNDFYLLRTESFEISTAGFDEMERNTTLGHHWWTADELRRTAETIYPVELLGLLVTAVGR